MEKVNLLEYIRHLQPTDKGNYYLIICPSCNQKEAYLYKNNFSINCNRLIKCKYKQNLFNYVKILPDYQEKVIKKKKEKKKYYLNEIEYGSWNDYDYKKETTPSEISLPQEFISISNNTNIPVINEVKKYLTNNRNINERKIEKYNLGYCMSGNYEDRVIIPSYDKDNKLNYFVARTLGKETRYNPKYTKPDDVSHKDIIPFESFIDWNYKIILVESVFDMMTVDYNTIPLIGTKLKFDYLLFKKLLKVEKPIFLSFNNDVAGFDVTEKISKLFWNYGKDLLYYIELYPYNDINEMKKREFLERKNNSILITEEFLMKKKLEYLE